MIKLLKLFLICSVFFNLACEKKEKGILYKEIEVQAPFVMPTIKEPNFNLVPKFNIIDYGALEGDKDKNTQAIAEAIQIASNGGGGIVIVPEGEWLTKKIHLKSNVNLHLNDGATLLFSDEPDDYLPAVHTTWEGMECYNYSPLIYAYGVENIAITGQGKLKAEMGIWTKWFGRPTGHMNSLKRLYNLASKDLPVEQRQMVNDSANFRPQFIQFNRCRNILVEGISIENSPFWVLHPYMSKNVIIRNIQVYAHGHNNDGVDPEMSENVLIENCVFDQGDDAIAIKAGRNQDAWRLNTPSKNIVIRNCLVKNGHQLLAIGSELSGGIENVYVENCEVMEGAKLNHLLFIKTNERRGGYVKNIHLKSIKSGDIDKGILGIDTDVLYQWRDLVATYERRLTPIQQIYLTDIKTGSIDFISKISANKELPVEDVVLNLVEVDSISVEEVINENVNQFHLSKNSHHRKDK